MTKKSTTKSKYDHLYKSGGRVVVLNEGDPDLDEIRVQLPEEPPFPEIINYGLPPSKQYFTRDEVPPRLKELDKRVWSGEDLKEMPKHELCWKEIAENYEYYKDELWFIEQAWKKRKEGVWFFINGTATYIPPWHYFYLNWFEMDSEKGGDYAEYRDRDRKFFIACHYAASTTVAHFKYKITNDKGEVRYSSSRKKREEAIAKEWEISSKGYTVLTRRRTVIGINYPKLRREGATTKAEDVGLEIITRMQGANMGIQSMTEVHASTVYNQFLLRGFRGLPFFFTPINENLINPQTHLRMQPKGNKGTPPGVRPLYSLAKAGPSNLKFFDTWKLKFYHGDEVGKTEEVDIYDRHYIVKKSMTTGSDANIVGLGINTSTVEDMDAGGENFHRLAKESHWRDRNDAGQTMSGYINIFIPSDEGLEGFIDEYGNSLKEKARNHILSIRDKYEEENKDDELVKEIRKTPLTFRECFTFVAKNKKFNIAKINRRLSQFAFIDQNPHVVRGTLEWVNWDSPDKHKYDIKNLPTIEDLARGKTYVRFVHAPEGAEDWDWEFSYLPGQEANRFFYSEQQNTLIPGNSALFRFGIDMYKYGEKTSSGKGSFGSGSIYRNFNPSVDNPMLPPEEAFRIGDDGDTIWKTDRFCGVYLKRPDDKNEFCEQQLMASVFFGVPAFPEINVPDVWDWFGRDRRFYGYLLHKIDRKTFRMDAQPGATTHSGVKNQIFNAWAMYIQKNAEREHHLVFLEQCKDILDSMNDFDAFVSGGYALIQESEIMNTPIEQSTIVSDISNVVRKYKV